MAGRVARSRELVADSTDGGWRLFSTDHPPAVPRRRDVNPTPSDVTGPVAVLLNPTAGRGRHRAAVPAVLATLRSTGRDVRVIEANGPQAALEAAHAAVAEGAAVLVTAGGDGTVNLGLQAVASTGIGFGGIPMGTGNDFIREVGLPSDPVAAASVIADAVCAGRRRDIDLARMVTTDGVARWYGAVL